jgi:succinyl-CoA synthetase beta subunit
MLLEYFKAKSLLDKYGIRSVDSKYINSEEEAVRFSRGSPIVMKVLSNKELHKSKAGLVKLDLKEESEIRKAYKELATKSRALRPCNIIVQKMADKGIETIFGGREDPQFGKLVLLGLGGVYVEAFKDFALRVCPITEYDASEMIDQLRSGSIITHNGSSKSMVTGLLLKTSKLLSENKEIKELDLNPVIITEKGYEVVDIRVLV